MSESLIMQYDQAPSDEMKASLIETWLMKAQDDKLIYDELIQLANHYSSLGYVELMNDLLIQLIKIRPSLDVFRLLAKNYERVQEFDLAIQILEQIPPNQRALEDDYQLAILYNNVGDQNTAISKLISLIKMEPTFFKAYLFLARLYEAQNDLERALYYLKPILDYASDDEMIKLARKQYIEVALNQEIVETSFLLSLFEHQEPETADDFLLLAMIYFHAEDYQHARLYAEKSLKKDATYEATLLLIEAYLLLDELDLIEAPLDWLIKNAHFDDLNLVDLFLRLPNELISDELFYYVDNLYEFIELPDDQYVVISKMLKYLLSQSNMSTFKDQLQEIKTRTGFDDILSYFTGIAAYDENISKSQDAFKIAYELNLPEPDVFLLYLKTLLIDGKEKEVKSLLSQSRSNLEISDIEMYQPWFLEET